MRFAWKLNTKQSLNHTYGNHENTDVMPTTIKALSSTWIANNNDKDSFSHEVTPRALYKIDYKRGFKTGHDCYCLYSFMIVYQIRGTLAQLIQALHHMTGGPVFDFRWRPWKFSSDLIFLSAFNNLGVHSASNSNATIREVTQHETSTVEGM